MFVKKSRSGGMVDTQRSGRCPSNGVEVQLLSSALNADVVKWYTRSLEVAMPVRVWRFNSSRPHIWTVSSAVERFVYIEDVAGSNPAPSTDWTILVD